MSERKNVITMKGEPLTLVGPDLQIGAAAVPFEVVDQDLKKVSFADFSGKTTLILSVPSLDTSVCNLEAKKFNEAIASYGDKVVTILISMDLPFAQKRICTADKIVNLRVYSDYQTHSFGLNWGVLIKELTLLARAVFIVNTQGKISYKQIVSEVSLEPAYDQVLAALKRDQTVLR